METKIKHIKIKVYGRVQGVFFRDKTKKKALLLNLKGFVRNEKDGSVYIEAKGDEENLSKLLDWCRKGPIQAKVEKVEYDYMDSLLIDFNNFKILY